VLDEVTGDFHRFSALDVPITASTANTMVAATEDVQRNFYGLQFHPEVVHTQCRPRRCWLTSSLIFADAKILGQ